MKTRELIHEARENILRDISTAVDRSRDADARWSDATLVRYLQDAEAKFAIQTLCLRDSTSPATRICLRAGQVLYPMHRSVRVVYAAQCGRTHLALTTYNRLLERRPPVGAGAPVIDPGAVGAPTHYYTDADSGHLGVYPTPGEGEDGAEVVLRVARLPLRPISLDRLDAESEIPEEYHLDLVDWACWRALRNQDADLEVDGEGIQLLMARATSHRNRFEAAVKECVRMMKLRGAQHVRMAVNTNWG